MAETENTPNELGMITYSKGAEMLGIGIVTFKKLVDEGKIPRVNLTDKLDRVMEQSVKDYVNNQVKPKEPVANTDNKNITAVNDEIILTKKRQELEALKSNFITTDEFKQAFDKLTQDRQEFEKEKENHAIKVKLLKAEEETFKAFKLDEEAKIAQGKAKNAEHLNSLKSTEETLKKKWTAENDKRQNESKLVLIHLDGLAMTVYNMNPQYIGKVAKEKLAENLEPILKHYGIPPVFNRNNEYVSLTSRLEMMGSKELSNYREDATGTPDKTELSNNIKQAYQQCLEFYKWLLKIQGGQEFTTWLYKELKVLEVLLYEKTPEEIEKAMNGLMEHFGAINRGLVSLAGKYDKSNHPNNATYSTEMDYILKVSDRIENLLGIANGD
jgi:hypothetical protein